MVEPGGAVALAAILSGKAVLEPGMLALLSGATSYRHIICFLEQRRLVLNALFGCTLKRAPSLNTLRTHTKHIFTKLDVSLVEQELDRLAAASAGE